MSQIDSRQALETSQGFEVSASDLIKLTGTETKNEYRDLKVAAEKLLNKIVTINNPFADEKKVTQLKTHWISSVAYIPNEGKIRLFFAHHLLPYISQLTTEFTKYHLQEVGKFSSIYSFRLFELIQQWKSTGKHEFEMEWIRSCFELGDKYSALKDFKLYVLDPAVKEINELTHYQVRWEQRKTGRKVTHLIFTFSEKNAPEDKESEKPKRTTKPKEKLVHGVPVSEIEAAARIGESSEDVAARINRTKQANKTAPVHAGDLAKDLKNGLKNKPQPAAPVSILAAAESNRIQIIKIFLEKNGKEKYLQEFKDRNCVTIHGVGGVVIESDLRLAGLFDD
jgi:plasmid replication initiation protein